MRKPRGQNWEVEVSPRAWEELGVVPGDVFRSILKELETVARRITADGLDDLQPGRLVSLTHGPYQAQYQLVLTEQLVVLQKVARRADDDLTSTGKRKRKG